MFTEETGRAGPVQLWVWQCEDQEMSYLPQITVGEARNYLKIAKDVV
ncbi:hypothetical protein JCM15831A_12010 [Asaia astilbis]